MRLMRRMGVMVLAAGMLVLAGCGEGGGGRGEFEGTWRYKQIVTSGKETPAEALGRAPLVVFEGNKMLRRKGDEVVDTWTYTVDKTADPKRMTITMENEKTYHYYYTLEGDTLTTIHANKRYSNEPNTKLEKGTYFTVYVRVRE